jgi:hypothetical protein
MHIQLNEERTRVFECSNNWTEVLAMKALAGGKRTTKTKIESGLKTILRASLKQQSRLFRCFMNYEDDSYWRLLPNNPSGTHTMHV